MDQENSPRAKKHKISASAFNLPPELLSALLQRCLVHPPYNVFLVCRNWHVACAHWIAVFQTQLSRINATCSRLALWEGIDNATMILLRDLMWTTMDALCAVHEEGMHAAFLEKLFLHDKFVSKGTLYCILSTLPAHAFTPARGYYSQVWNSDQFGWLARWNFCCPIVAHINSPLVWKANLLVQAIKYDPTAERLVEPMLDALFDCVVKEGTPFDISKFINAASKHWRWTYWNSAWLHHTKCTLALVSFQACMRLLLLGVKLPDTVMQTARENFTWTGTQVNDEDTSVLTVQCYKQHARDHEHLLNGEWDCCQPPVWAKLVECAERSPVFTDEHTLAHV